MKRAFAASAAAFVLAAAQDASAEEAEPAKAAPASTAQPSFVDGEQQVHAFQPTYDEWFGRRRPHYGRAAIEITGLMGLGFLYYWSDPLANKEDWDNPSMNDRATLRFLRFDTNLNTTNHLLHPLAGGLVFGTARVNGLSIPASFAYGAAQTVLWELTLEWREKASINDLVSTGIGGVPIGEFIHQASGYFASAPSGGSVQRAVGWSLGFPTRVHMALDHRKEPSERLPPDSLGFSSAYGHDFGLAYEGASMSNDVGASGVMHRVRVDAAIVAMPGFLAPGQFSKFFSNGNFTELHARLGTGSGDSFDSDLQVRTTLFGRYEQNFSVDDKGGLEGHATMIGFGPALRFQASNYLGRHDQLSAVHVAGVQAEVWVADGDLMARFGGEAYADFGSLQSLAYPEFVERYGAEGTKSVLQRQGYAYSLGGSTRLRGAVGVGPVALTASAGYGRYGSIDVLDRFQESITNNPHGTEGVLELEAEASLRLGRVVVVGGGYRERRRTSTLADITERRMDRDFHLVLGLSF